MPRIETINASVGLEPGRAPNVQADTSIYTASQGLGNALGNAGAVLGQIAARANALQEQQQRFDIATMDDERRQKIATAMQEAQQNMPVGGRGFHEGVVAARDKINAEYQQRMQAINPKFAAQYQQRWSGGEAEEWSRRAAAVEQKTGADYYRGQLVQRADQILTAVKATPDEKVTDAALARWRDEFLAAAPYLSPAEKEELNKAVTNKALFEEFISRHKTKAEAQRSLGMAAGGNAGDMTLAAIRKFEGFRATPYFDVNALRTGYGSDTITKADGTVVKVTAGMTVTREDAERDLQRRVNTEFLPKARAAVGEEQWGKLPAGAQAALTSITYNYGKLPASVAAAARTGDVAAIAGAVRGLKGHNEGVNAKRREEEARMVETGGPAAGNPRYAALPFEMRQQAITRVERDERAAMAENRANVQIAERDANAAYLAGRMDFSGAPTREQFIAAYGPEEGARRALTLEQNRQTGEAVLRFQTMKPEDIAREVAAAQQAVAAAPGFVENAQRVAVLQKAAQEVIKRREDDPVAETVRHSPAASRAYQNLSQALQSGDTAAIRAAAGAWAGVSRETLGQMGIASTNIVPKAYAQSVANNIRQLAGEGKLQEAHAQLMQQMDMWGADWKHVQGQLIQAGLPGVVMVASTMNRPDQRQSAGQLMQAVAVGRKEFEKVLGEGVLKEIKEAAEKNNLAMDRTFASSPNSNATSLAIKESVETLAMLYTRQGDTPAKAAERAYQDIIGKKYHPITLGQTYRVPAETNLPKVRFGMAATVERLDKLGIDPPQTMLRGMRPEDVSKQYLAAIRANHRWITNGDESGLVMLDQWGAPVMRGGKPLSMTWKELEEADASGPNVRVQPPGERGDVLPRAIMRPMPRGPAPLQ